MQPYNLYLLTRIREPKTFNKSEFVLSGRQKMSTVKDHEIASARSLVDTLYAFAPEPALFDGFVFSYTIPHIGKEFDLLKITDKGILNYELKSVNVGKKAIKEQLLSNRYYLKHLSLPLCQCTYVMKENRFYALDENDELVVLPPQAAAVYLQIHDLPHKTDFDGLFDAGDYMISPTASPEAFINDGYFLTLNQQQIKKKVLAGVENRTSLHTAIVGSAGTGKTLLLYDLAKELSKTDPAVFIHPGMLSEGHKILEEGIPLLKILSSDGISEEDIPKETRCLFFDDVHRLGKKLFTKLSDYADRQSIHCFYTYDKAQYFEKNSMSENIPGIIEKMKDVEIRRLTDTIRTNEKLQALTEAIFNLQKKQNVDKSRLYIHYVQENELEDAVRYFQDRGLPVIDCRKDTQISPHLYAGAEYKAAAVVLDDRFFYTKSGTLRGHKEEKYLPMNILRCALSRVEEELTLITTDKNLYGRLLTVYE